PRRACSAPAAATAGGPTARTRRGCRRRRPGRWPARVSQGIRATGPASRGPRGGTPAWARRACRCAGLRSRCRGRSLWRELRQIVDPQRLLDARHLIHLSFESFFAEEVVLALFEAVAQPPVLALAGQLAESGKELGVL